VTVVLDCGEHGPAIAAAIEEDLSSVCETEVLDRAPDGNDGDDVTDRLLDDQRLELAWP
jgi:hypothetical protein